jgi:hypothetical protein
MKYTRRIAALPLSTLLALGTLGCERLDRFDNKDGSAYCGNIISAEFVREGFETLPRLQLQLDMSALDTFPGRLTTDDSADGPCRPLATFNKAKLRVSSKLQADALSQLEFGEQRELNLVGWVDSACDGTYLAVVSLLRDDDVEVRLMRSQANAKHEETGPFGVFKLSRRPTDCGF